MPPLLVGAPLRRRDLARGWHEREYATAPIAQRSLHSLSRGSGNVLLLQCAQNKLFSKRQNALDHWSIDIIPLCMKRFVTKA